MSSHVVQFIHSLQIGGAEVLAAQIASGLRGRGFQASVWGMAGSGVMQPMLQRQGIETLSFNCPMGVSLTVMGSLCRAMVDEKVDTVITHHFRQLLHAVPAVVLARKRLIHVEHDYHFYEQSPRYLAPLRFLLRFAAHFVAVSPELAASFDRGLGRSGICRPIVNGIDTDRFVRREEARGRLRAEHGMTGDELVVGTCCRLEPVKNVALLLEGFALYARRNREARLMVIGDGTERKRLEQMASDLGVEGRVVFAGMWDNVEEYLSMFDIFALTSRNEGLPLAVLEAMSATLPVVATSVGVLPSLVGHDAGVLLSRHEPEAVAAAINRLENPAVRSDMGARARARIQEKHSCRAMIDAYITLLGERGGVSANMDRRG